MSYEPLDELEVSITALRGVADLASGKGTLSSNALNRVATLLEMLAKRMEEESEALRQMLATA